MKSNILKAYKEGRSTYVTLQTKYGTFNGKVTCADEDLDIQNDMDGYTFAEDKCFMQSAKKKASYLEQRAIGVTHAYNVLVKSGIAENDPVMEKLKRQMNIANREAEDAKKVYLTLKNTFKTHVSITLDTRRKLQQKANEL